MGLFAGIGAIAREAADRVIGAFAPELEYRMKLISARLNEFGYDKFGFSPQFLKYISLPAIFLYRHYFRVVTKGVENLRPGRLLVVGNHSGQIPLDGAMVIVAALLEANPPRVLRSMAERFFPNIPFASIVLPRTGQVLGTPANCVRVLQDEEAILVFPEGVRGINKTFDKRYELQEFGHGFMRLALQTKTPIVPFAVVGAEEQAPSIYSFRSLGKLLGFPELPIVPYPPFVPILPLPVKYHIQFGEPMIFEGDPHDDEAVIEKKVRAVKNTIQTMIRMGLRERKHIFW